MPGDPFCELKFEGADRVVEKTKVKMKTTNPSWDHTFFVKDYALGSSLELVVKDWDLISESDVLGRVELNPKEFFPMGIKKGSYALTTKKTEGKAQGQMELTVEVMPAGSL